jgi:hypothetical protein
MQVPAMLGADPIGDLTEGDDSLPFAGNRCGTVGLEVMHKAKRETRQ